MLLLDTEIKHKETHAWYKLYGACVCLDLISQCGSGGAHQGQSGPQPHP